MSLRNEPRAGLDYSTLQANMKLGAEAVSEIASDLLIIVSGYWSATDLSREKMNPLPNILSEAIKKRFVYEGHHYPWLAVDQFQGKNLTKACLVNKKELHNRLYHVLDLGYPFILSEWGLNLSDQLKKSPSWIWFNCFYSDLIQLDLDNRFGQY